MTVLELRQSTHPGASRFRHCSSDIPNETYRCSGWWSGLRVYFEMRRFGGAKIRVARIICSCNKYVKGNIDPPYVTAGCYSLSQHGSHTQHQNLIGSRPALELAAGGVEVRSYTGSTKKEVLSHLFLDIKLTNLGRLNILNIDG